MHKCAMNLYLYGCYCSLLLLFRTASDNHGDSSHQVQVYSTAEYHTRTGSRRPTRKF